MRLSTPLGLWTATFFTTLGLAPLTACSGSDVGSSNDGQQEGDAGTGGSPGGGGAGSGGRSSGGTPVSGAGNVGGAGNGGAGNGGAGNGGAGGVSVGAGGNFIATGGTGSGGSSGAFLQCRSPSPLLGPDGQPTGFSQCEGGGIHRPAKVDCGSLLPRAEACPFLVAEDAGFTNGCTVDADCTERPHGYCAGGGGQLPGCYCSYGCTTDADCGAGSLCLCGAPVGQCVAAECTLNADCGGALCLSYTQDPGCGGTAFACQSTADTCVGDGDCAEAGGGTCALVLGKHQCEDPMCAIGRPFLVLGEARTAGEARRADWASERCPLTEGLGSEDRAAIGARWTEIALMEHASIAAFARFALELIGLGAPPELLVATHQAMADETVHARDAFALSSAYLGRPVGPGALDVGAALAARSPLEIVRTAMLEGCIGETIAAVEAAEALVHATDPAVRAVLERVTEDETRHAELAWRFVQWVLRDGAPELRAAAAQELEALVSAELASSVDVRAAGSASPAALAAHGLVGAATRQEIRRRVLAEVVTPAARALVAAARQAGHTALDARAAA